MNTFKFKSFFDQYINKSEELASNFTDMSKLSLNNIQIKINTNIVPKKSNPTSTSMSNTTITFNQTFAKTKNENAVQCKKVDNSALVLSTSTELTTTKGFVPLAIPVEKHKKSIAGLESFSSKHDVIINSRPNSTSSAGPQPNLNLIKPSKKKASKQPTDAKKSSSTKNRENIPGSNLKKKTTTTQSSAMAENHKLLNYQSLDARKSQDRSFDRILPPSSQKHKGSEKALRPETSAEKSRPKLPPRKMISNTESSISPEKREHRDMPKKEREKTKSLSREPFKAAGIGKLSAQKLANKEKSVDSKIDKSMINPEVENLIQNNAVRYLENIKAIKEQKEFEKRYQDERKAALEEGNRRIREANLKRFNQDKNEKPPVPWGYDQRKLNMKREEYGFEESPKQKQGNPYLDDKERRNRLGLGNYDDEALNNLRKKSVNKINLTDQSIDSIKPKKVLSEDERARIQNFILKKKEQIEKEKHEKKLEDYIEFEKRRQNLQKLFSEIQENKTRIVKKPVKKNKKLKPKKKQTNPDAARVYLQAQPMINNFIPQGESEDMNYSRLQQEYEQIIKMKQARKHEESVSSNYKQPALLQNSTPGKYSSQGEGDNSEHPESSERKEELKQRFSDLANRFQRIQSGSKMKNNEEKRYSDHKEPMRQPDLENETDEAQKAIEEFEPSNFSDNDYLRSDSLVIRGEGEDADYNDDDVEEDDIQEDEYQAGFNHKHISDDSIQEIRDAAAIFIQKNYRGYRTRKILREYFNLYIPDDEHYYDNRIEERNTREEAGTEDDEALKARKKSKQPKHEESDFDIEKEFQEDDEGEIEPEDLLIPNGHGPQYVFGEEDQVEQEDLEEDQDLFGATQKKNIIELLEKQRKFVEQQEEKKNLAQQQVNKKQIQREPEPEPELDPGYYDDEIGEDEDGNKYRVQYDYGDDEDDEDEDPRREPIPRNQNKILPRKANSDGGYERDDYEDEPNYDQNEEDPEDHDHHIPTDLQLRHDDDLDLEVDDDLKNEIEKFGHEDTTNMIGDDEWDDDRENQHDDNNHLNRPLVRDTEKLILVSTIHSDEEHEQIIKSTENLQIPAREPIREVEPRKTEDILKKITQNNFQNKDRQEKSPEKKAFFQSPIEYEGSADLKNTPELNFQGTIGAKSLVTVGEFGEEEKMTTFGASPDIATTKKMHSKSDSDYLRDKLIEALNFGPDEIPEEQESSKDKSIRTQNADKDVSPKGQQGKVGNQSTLELTSIFQNEIAKLKEDQAKKWTDMMNQLNMLQLSGGTEMNQQLRVFIDNLQKQSELNKKMLFENIELKNLIATTNLSEDKTQGMETLLNNFRAMNTAEVTNPNLYTPNDYSKDTSADFSISSKKPFDSLSPSEVKPSKHIKKNFWAKRNLQIDINTINDDNKDNEEIPEALGSATSPNEGMNLDLAQMRLVLGSEQAVREQSARTLSQSVSTPRKPDGQDYNSDMDPIELQSGEFINTATGSIFEKDPFQEFTQKKFTELLQHENMNKVIQMREKALEYRHQSQVENLQKMLDNKRYSPRTFQHKKIELEKWITREKETLQRSKKDIERGWQMALDAIKRVKNSNEINQKTQRDLQFLQKVYGPGVTGEPNLRASAPEEDIGRKLSARDEADEETKSEQMSRRPFGFPGLDVRSPPNASNKIKIIDKFEIADSVPSQKQNYDIGSSAEDKKKIYELDSPEFDGSLGSTFKDSQALGKKLKEIGVESKDYGYDEEFEQNIKDLSRDMGELNFKKNLNEPSYIKGPLKDSPGDRKVSSDEDVDEGVNDEEIQWEGEAMNSPNYPEKERNYLEKSLKPSDLHQFEPMKPMHIELGANIMVPVKSPITSPKSPQELRQLFYDKFGKAGMDQRNKQEENILSSDEFEDGQAHKVDRVCEEVLNSLIVEFHSELSGNKRHIAEKILGFDNYNQGDLKNFVEQNLFISPEKHHSSYYPENQNPAHHELRHEGRDRNFNREERDYHDIQNDLFKSLGIKTEHQHVSGYLDAVIEEIMNSYVQDFVRLINIPIGLTVAEKLNNMHAYDTMASESSIEMGGLQQPVLNIELYLKVEQKVTQPSSRNEISIELEHIHNKMIFDSLNEILDSFRPYGFNGQSYPWKNTVKNNKPVPVNARTMKNVLLKAKKKVLEWAECQCGYYGDKEEFLQDKTNSFCDEYLAQAKEDKLSRMLNIETNEMEEKWINYDDEETEVEIELADLIFDKLMTETSELILHLGDARRRGVAPIKNF